MTKFIHFLFLRTFLLAFFFEWLPLFAKANAIVANGAKNLLPNGTAVFINRPINMPKKAPRN